MPDLVAIIPAYNEGTRIGNTIEALRATFPGVEIIVADDGSGDDTAAVAARAECEVVRVERTIGKGGVANLALQRVKDRQFDQLLLVDGDLGSSSAQLKALVDAVQAGECDLAIAAFKRRVGGGFGIAVGFAHWAIKNLTGLDLTAPISGQRALSRHCVEAVTPLAPKFGMEIGMTVDAARAGMRIKEIELDLEHRATGRSFKGFVHRGRQLKDFLRVFSSRKLRR